MATHAHALDGVIKSSAPAPYRRHSKYERRQIVAAYRPERPATDWTVAEVKQAAQKIEETVLVKVLPRPATVSSRPPKPQPYSKQQAQTAPAKAPFYSSRPPKPGRILNDVMAPQVAAPNQAQVSFYGKKVKPAFPVLPKAAMNARQVSRPSSAGMYMDVIQSAPKRQWTTPEQAAYQQAAAYAEPSAYAQSPAGGWDLADGSIDLAFDALPDPYSGSWRRSKLAYAVAGTAVALFLVGGGVTLLNVIGKH